MSDTLRLTNRMHGLEMSRQLGLVVFASLRQDLLDGPILNFDERWLFLTEPAPAIAPTIIEILAARNITTYRDGAAFSLPPQHCRWIRPPALGSTWLPPFFTVAFTARATAPRAPVACS